MIKFHAFFWLSSIPPCVCVCVCVCVCIYLSMSLLLYPFICRWTLRLLPNLGDCIYCCSEHWGACIFSNQCFLRFVVCVCLTYTQEWNCGVILQFLLQFFELPPCYFPQQLHQFTFPVTVHEGYLFSVFASSSYLCSF